MKLLDYIANGTGHGVVYGEPTIPTSSIANIGEAMIWDNMKPPPQYCHNKTELIIGKVYQAVVSQWKRQGVVESRDSLYRTVLACENLYDDDDKFFMPLLFGWAVPQFTILAVRDYHLLCPAEISLLARTKARVIAFGEPCVTLNDLGGTLCE